LPATAARTPVPPLPQDVQMRRGRIAHNKRDYRRIGLPVQVKIHLLSAERMIKKYQAASRPTSPPARSM
jgi:hypothetical protein